MRVAEVPVAGRKLSKFLVPAAVVLVAVAIGGAVYFRSRSAAPATKAAPLSEKDTIVLADFDNTTGDEVFEGALKQALTVDLGQSLSQCHVRPQGGRYVTFDGSRLEMTGLRRKWRGKSACGRGAKHVLSGSISRLGSQYLVGVEAVSCSTGDRLAKEQGEAASKEDVLKALGQVASNMRAKLGESLASVQKFDVPIEATTPSLEALKTYSMGITTEREKGDAEAFPFTSVPSN